MPKPNDPLSAADIYDETHAYLRALIGAHPLPDPRNLTTR